MAADSGGPPEHRGACGPHHGEHGHRDRPPERRGACPQLADGRWHRLHPLSPWLRGGLLLLTALGWFLGQFGGDLLRLLLAAPQTLPDRFRDPTAPVLLGAAFVLAPLLIVAGSLLSWRCSAFRIAAEVVEERRGVLSRRHRQARLDRVQSVDVRRPLLARLFGLAGLHLDTAGADGEIGLRYLRADQAEQLRAEILRLASGAKRRATDAATPAEARPDGPPQRDGRPRPDGAGPVEPGGGLADLVRRRIAEFQEDPADAAPPASLVRLGLGRLLGSLLLEGGIGVLLFLLIGASALGAVLLFAAGSGAGVPAELRGILAAVFALSWLLPSAAVVIGSAASRVLPNLRYSVIGTVDGARITRGLFSVVSETLPPGRVHAVELRQPLLWRPFGWWEVRAVRAGRSGSEEQGEQGVGRTVLPIGSFEEARRVAVLLMPALAAEPVSRALAVGAGRPVPGDPYTRSPRGGALVRPLSFRRSGLALVDGVLLARSGALTRRIGAMPLERMQSGQLSAGPRQRLAGVATVRAHLVPGSVALACPVVAGPEAGRLFERLRRGAVEAAARDTSHRWRQAAARTAVEAARMRLAAASGAGAAPDPRDLALLEALRVHEEREEADRTGAA